MGPSEGVTGQGQVEKNEKTGPRSNIRPSKHALHGCGVPAGCLWA